jgi:hypothetical protein
MPMEIQLGRMRPSLPGLSLIGRGGSLCLWSRSFGRLLVAAASHHTQHQAEKHENSPH